ncbi:MAG: efflux transporter outer membrane subunit [Rikenellaceae bacterium]
MRHIRPIPTIAALLATLAIFACSPRLTQSDDTPPSTWIFGEGSTTDSLHLPLRWWESFGDTTLNRLVTIGLNKNRDLTAAAAKLTAAQQNIRYVRSEYLPSLYLSVEAEGEYTNSTKTVQTYAIEPTVSWEIPLFGQLRHTSRRARAEALSSAWSVRAMRLSIAAEIATSYFTLIEAQQNLAIARRSCVLRGEESQLIDSMYHYGLSDGIAREQARSLLYTAQSDVATYERAVQQTQMSLSLLLGENPTTILAEEFEQRIPQPIPIGLPSELLERRPDIVESYNTMEAAAAAVGLARSARYPSISLTADGGVASSAIKDLTSGKPWVWSATATLVQPIFNFGRLRSAERVAQAEYAEAVAEYEQTILTAFSEVEQALSAISTYATQREAMVKLVAANEKIAHTTSALYDNGMNDYLNVIDAERELYSSQMELLSVVANQYISHITLYKALGGGY